MEKVFFDKKEAEDFLNKLKFKKISYLPPAVADYYINKKGFIFSFKKHKNKNKVFYKIREVNTTLSTMNGLKFNFYDGKKTSSKSVGVAVYETFKGKKLGYNQLVFLDNNRKNCNIDNLISIDELINFYNTYKDNV